MEGLDRDYLEDLERRLRDAGRTASVDEANPATLEESDRDAEDADIQEAHDGHRRQQRLAGRQSCPYDHPLGYPLEVGLGPDDLEQKMQHLLSEEATARKEMRRQYEIQLALVRQVEDARVSRAKQTTLAELQETLSLYKCVAEESVQVAKAEREKFRKELEKARFTARKVCEELESELRLEYEARISTLETETKAQADRFAKKEADLHRTVSKLEIQAADGASQFDEQVVKEAENRV
ncbi:MAG: hypothetical protein KVP17_002166 [Porospora cf. gigantea B]|uniref:uncharacterized protein n=1 Tax=Porospora cf. gigantea B TaxID=2853592 RepID=UPI003571F369|nr:MAG: hypothetical protein KVP17_002166 [Porospora cf. gigantea B]